jgi:hypothetical protein
MLHHAAFVRTDVSEESIASIIRVIRIGEIGTMLAVTSNRNAVLKRATWRHIQEDCIVHSQRRENIRSYRYNTNFWLGNSIPIQREQDQMNFPKRRFLSE